MAALAEDGIGAVVCQPDGTILWQNAAAAGQPERLAALAGQGARTLRSAEGTFRISPLWPAEEAPRLVRGPLDDRAARLMAAIHDMRIPLQALSAAAEDAAADTDGKTARIGALAVDVLERLESVLDDLSDRADRPRDFAPLDIVLRLAGMLAPLGHAGQVRVEVLRPDRPVMIHGNPADFAAIVQNLLGNAIRHTRGGRVRVALLTLDDMVALSVRDEGPGLPDPIARFLAEGREPDRHLHGLRIARDRVAAMDGSLQHIPHPDGTELRALLPGRLADDPLPEGAVVMIVEDNPVNAGIFAGIVRDMGAMPEVVTRAADVPAQLPAEVAAVLLDVSLPDASGLDVARRIRASHPHLPVLGITGHAGAGMRDDCLRAGMSDVLVKPVRAAELRLTLSHLARAVPLLDEAHYRDLAADLGAPRVADFLRRALDESEALLPLLSSRAPDAEARIHSATGSAGMTGLRALERELRRVERLVRGGDLPEAHRQRLAVILRRSRDAVDRVAAGQGAAECR